MIRSLRARLQWWYGGVYVISIIVFGCLVFWRAARDLNDLATLQAVSTAQIIDSQLRNFAGDQPSANSLPDGFTIVPFPLEFNFDIQRGPRRSCSQAVGSAAGDLRQTRLNGADSLAELQHDRSRPEDEAFRNGPPDERNHQRPPKRPPIDRIEFAVWRPDGSVLTCSESFSADLSAIMPSTPRQDGAINVDHNEFMIHAMIAGPAGLTTSVFRPLEHDKNRLDEFGIRIVSIATGTLLVGLIGGWWVSGRMVQPIQMISETAAKISATSLDRRIDTEKLDTELVPVATVLNDTFARLEDSLTRLTQFTADASHELRTPLAVVQSQIELALSRPRSVESYQQTLQTCLQSSERMSALVDGLLLLARTDAERLLLPAVSIDLRLVVQEAIRHLQEKANSLDIELNCSIPTSAVLVLADVHFLTQVPFNLIDNAIKHSKSGDAIHVEVRMESGHALLTVRDTGSGISDEHCPHIFERFYRVDTGRSREQGGTGLGLAICQSIITAYGGDISCESTIDVGSTFIVRLPLADAATKSTDEIPNA